MKIVLNMNRKTTKLVSLWHFLQTIPVEHHVRSRRNQSHIALWLLLQQKDEAPCGSGAATMVFRIFSNKGLQIVVRLLLLFINQFERKLNHEFP
jgi:hypothetical protein